MYTVFLVPVGRVSSSLISSIASRVDVQLDSIVTSAVKNQATSNGISETES